MDLIVFELQNKRGSISQKELSETAEEYLGINPELIDQAIVACAKLTDAQKPNP